MNGPEDPPGFIVRTEVQKAAFERGFRLERGSEHGWLRYGSTTAPVQVWIAGAGSAGPWFVAVDHAGVAAELGPSAALPGPGFARFVFPMLGGLYDALDRIWRLARSLPTVPLATFQQQTAGLPRTTEAERWTVQRIGQDVFRQALLDYWGGRCPLTGITDTALLRASHIVPWAECATDAQRLDVHNGLLLSALWDAAFDAGLLSFADDGMALLSPALSPSASKALEGGHRQLPEVLSAKHRENLTSHRVRHGFQKNCHFPEGLDGEGRGR